MISFVTSDTLRLTCHVARDARAVHGRIGKSAILALTASVIGLIVTMNERDISSGNTESRLMNTTAFLLSKTGAVRYAEDQSRQTGCWMLTMTMQPMMCEDFYVHPAIAS